MQEMAKNKTVIVGLGVTGLSCARFLAFKKEFFCIVDTRVEPAMAADFAREFSTDLLYTGGWHEEIIQSADRLIVSPGISLKEPVISKAINTGVEIVSDIDLLLSAITCPVAAITGSNGKTTVTTVLGEMAKASGLNVVVAGNIGLPVLDAYLQSLKDEKTVDLYILELSSFQLERVGHIHAKAACVLNVTPDHMDRYDSLESYAATKRHIFVDAKACIYNANDLLTKPEHSASNLSDKESSEATLVYTLAGDSTVVFGVDGTYLLKENQAIMPIDELALKGKHNQFNALVAYAMGERLGLSNNAMLDTMKTFKGLAHRCENIGKYQGVTFINDSKGTNEGACIAAIKGLADKNQKNIILIAGGDDKGAEFSELNSVLRDHVKYTVLIGHAQDKLKELFVADNKLVLADNMSDAVSLAYQEAVAGDIVLLSPACASFDMFKGFEHRGQAFIDAVQDLVKEEVLP